MILVNHRVTVIDPNSKYENVDGLVVGIDFSSNSSERFTVRFSEEELAKHGLSKGTAEYVQFYEYELMRIPSKGSRRFAIGDKVVIAGKDREFCGRTGTVHSLPDDDSVYNVEIDGDVRWYMDSQLEPEFDKTF